MAATYSIEIVFWHYFYKEKQLAFSYWGQIISQVVNLNDQKVRKQI